MCWKADHPRVCGEKQIRACLEQSQLGSPPRVRGEAGLLVDEFRRAGITPACAGRRRQGCRRS